LIVVARNQIDCFEPYLPGKVHFIPLGVDSGFFCPSTKTTGPAGNAGPRCVFSGTWLRDFRTLALVIDQLPSKNSSIGSDLIVPKQKRADPHLDAIGARHQVAWHDGLSDEALRDVYRNASMPVLPLLDNTANSSLLESMALPACRLE
jgi:hypothetical protein